MKTSSTNRFRFVAQAVLLVSLSSGKETKSQTDEAYKAGLSLPPKNED